MKKRIEWVDVFKGIGIILVVIGHTTSPIGAYIYLFHMAAFFFISGYTTSLEKDSLKDYFLKKVKTLLIPFFTINILFIFIRVLLHLLKIDLIFFKDVFNLTKFKTAFSYLFEKLSPYVDLGGATWFLVILFFTALLAKVIYNLLYRLKKKEELLFIISILFIILGFHLYSKKIYYIFNFDLCFTAIFFFISGIIFKKHKILENEINHKYAVPLAIFFIYFFGRIYYAGVNWPTRQFGNIIITILVSFTGIYLLYLISIFFKKFKRLKNILMYTGRKTLSILMLHFLAFRISFLLFYFFGIIPKSSVSNLVPELNNNYWHILTVLSILIVFGLYSIIVKIPKASLIVFGEKREKKVAK